MLILVIKVGLQSSMAIVFTGHMWFCFVNFDDACSQLELIRKKQNYYETVT